MKSQGDNLGSLLNSVTMAQMREQMDVAEVYSPPRVVEMAKKMGLRAGWSLDFTTTDDEGNPWDFNKAHMRNKVVRKLLTDKPRFSIGSPMCTAFSAMNYINHARMSPTEVQQRFAYGRRHLDLCMKLYELQ